MNAIKKYFVLGTALFTLSNCSTYTEKYGPISESQTEQLDEAAKNILLYRNIKNFGNVDMNKNTEVANYATVGLLTELVKQNDSIIKQNRQIINLLEQQSKQKGITDLKNMRENLRTP